MRCPVCENEKSKVVDSREVDNGRAMRRRRECLKCNARFSTYEQVEILDLSVIKKNNRIEPYNLMKIEDGIRLAFKKRPIADKDIQAMLNNIEREIVKEVANGKIRTDKIGEIVLKEIKKWDEVAYIRFASVYRSFDNLEGFKEELDKFNK
ncbi:MAG: transcriptional regulator, NrdR family [uncultured bacterium]|nr:MAG: transcriptional regulator, NrdR family [uncultured bacterium]